MKTQIILASSLFIFLLTLSGCQNPFKKAARNMQYSAYEVVGIQKRDLLKSRVDDARDEQKEAGKDFQDALTRLRAITGFKGGNLENQYDSLKTSYDRASAQAEDVRKSIVKVETVAKDLFDEWNKEIDQIETPSLKAKSRKTLADTEEQYAKLHASLKSSEARMEPVLNKFNDQVLYLKHNLNAKAIASLKGEAVSIENDIEKLIAEMNRSIASADRFIEQMP